MSGKFPAWVFDELSAGVKFFCTSEKHILRVSYWNFLDIFKDISQSAQKCTKSFIFLKFLHVGGHKIVEVMDHTGQQLFLKPHFDLWSEFLLFKAIFQLILAYSAKFLLKYAHWSFA